MFLPLLSPFLSSQPSNSVSSFYFSYPSPFYLPPFFYLSSQSLTFLFSKTPLFSSFSPLLSLFFFSLPCLPAYLPLFPLMLLPLLSPLLLYTPSTLYSHSISPIHLLSISPISSISLLSLCPFSHPPFLPSPPSTPAPNSSSFPFLSFSDLSTIFLCSISHLSSFLLSFQDPVVAAGTCFSSPPYSLSANYYDDGYFHLFMCH